VGKGAFDSAAASGSRSRCYAQDDKFKEGSIRMMEFLVLSLD